MNFKVLRCYPFVSLPILRSKYSVALEIILTPTSLDQVNSGKSAFLVYIYD